MNDGLPEKASNAAAAAERSAAETAPAGAAAELLPLFFGFFNEVGILQQLSRAMLERRLPDGVTVAHFSVLNHLIRVNDGQTPLKLASAFQVPKTTMTHTLAGLESRGLVTLKANPADGRSKLVWLTETGRAFRDEAIAAIGPDVARLASKIDADAIRAVLPILANIRETLDRERDLPSP